MKKIFLAAFIALCGVSFSFGEGKIACRLACMQNSQTEQEQQNCIAENCDFYEEVEQSSVSSETEELGINKDIIFLDIERSMSRPHIETRTKP